MRLINTTTLELKSFADDDEVTYQEIMTRDIRSSPVASKKGFHKIAMTCRLAREKHALEWAWIDTCCIDKSSSAELSEAINSMYDYYSKSEICFACLEELNLRRPEPPDDEDSVADSGGSDDGWEVYPKGIQACRWFSRGWTLQGLIAPSNLEFRDSQWNIRGTKKSLSKALEIIAGICEEVLKDGELHWSPVATRMSWAARRNTKRDEDMAYCLLGIFDVNMPLLYGEGGEKAFLRLQEEILKINPNPSLFAWTTDWLTILLERFCGVLATSPSKFRDTPRLLPTTGLQLEPPDISTTRIPPRLWT
ncbi:heterokaryon incompatibility protein-domain-containing protein [Podospora didyma]|uniref:Heterokaryon incompatibility protein-domain-containing protein n=1 Tax=Podospora didyma TaxID=330526 RepID=A0AAE0NXX7_9PEZI|nr:heterokaryon incompatibility protein-domain-containing protein [Podospora didyma]